MRVTFTLFFLIEAVCAAAQESPLPLIPQPLRVDRADAGKGYLLDPLPPCDGLITNDPAVTLITGHADCMAFYFVDPVKRAIGLAHAGWRGALGRIGAAVVSLMQ